MRLLNRTAVTIIGAQPYVEWARARDASFNEGKLTIARTKAYGTAYLLPEFTDETDLLEWVEENHTWLFEYQLAAWTEDESAWPKSRDLKTFREWFRVDVHSTVVDAGDDEQISGEEL
jgi:hypothetical protein